MLHCRAYMTFVTGTLTCLSCVFPLRDEIVTTRHPGDEPIGCAMRSFKQVVMLTNAYTRKRRPGCRLGRRFCADKHEQQRLR